MPSLQLSREERRTDTGQQPKKKTPRRQRLKLRRGGEIAELGERHGVRRVSLNFGQKEKKRKEKTSKKDRMYSSSAQSKAARRALSRVPRKRKVKLRKSYSNPTSISVSANSRGCPPPLTRTAANSQTDDRRLYPLFGLETAVNCSTARHALSGVREPIRDIVRQSFCARPSEVKYTPKHTQPEPVEFDGTGGNRRVSVSAPSKDLPNASTGWR
ncbi:hypothetical protein B0H11DRAFT_1914097 [Mycena galericulata]|nr:hypothetical protein B0H11DRAFT_1914097 [Mycena galericulata]